MWCLQEAPSYPVVTTRPRFGRFHFASLSGCGSDLISCSRSAGSRDSNPDVRLDKKLILTPYRMCDVGLAATGGGAFILKPVPSPFVFVSGSVLPITLRNVGSNHGDWWVWDSAESPDRWFWAAFEGHARRRHGCPRRRSWPRERPRSRRRLPACGPWLGARPRRVRGFRADSVR